MHDHMDDFEIDEHGHKRRKRVLRDLEQISFPMTMAFKDAAGFYTRFSDGSRDHTSPHRPGYRFLDVNDEAKLAADQAYAERSARMENAWRLKDGEQRTETRSAPPRTMSLDAAQAAANRAYEQRNERLRNAWKDRDA